MTPEGLVKSKIVKYLKSVPGLWYTPIAQNGYGKTGVPDYLICYRGRFVALEVKSGEDKPPTAPQRREIAAIINAEGIAEVVWSVQHVVAIVCRIAHGCE